MNRWRLSTSRISNFRADVLLAGSTACGKSITTGPSAAISTLNSDRSPCTIPAQSMRTTAASSISKIRRATSGAYTTSPSRGAGWPSWSTTSSITSTPSMKWNGVGTRTPASLRR